MYLFLQIQFLFTLFDILLTFLKLLFPFRISVNNPVFIIENIGITVHQRNYHHTDYHQHQKYIDCNTGTEKSFSAFKPLFCPSLSQLRFPSFLFFLFQLIFIPVCQFLHLRSRRLLFFLLLA